MAEFSLGLSSVVDPEVIAKALNNAFPIDICVSNPKDARDEQDLLASGGMVLKYRLIDAAASSSNGGSSSNLSALDLIAAKSPLSNTARRRMMGSSRAAISQAPPFPFGAKLDDKTGSSSEGKDEESGGSSNPAVVALRQENEALRRKLAELEANHRQSLATIKTFHQSQQQLFNDFVLLREKYDEAKGRMAEILWGYLPAQTSFCPSIPAGHLTLLESDKRVGDYEIGDKLGEGQFAMVYKCKRRRPEAGLAGEGKACEEKEGKEADEGKGGEEEDDDLALKIINKERVSSLAALKRVDNEVLAQTTLRHRGILHIYDVINGRKGLYLVMEKGGKDLFDYSDENPERLGEADCRRIARSIIDAIHHCHVHSICHRDLKPENILLNTTTQASSKGDEEEGSMFDVKVCDFGLSATFVKGKKLSDFCGSPGFFAPEMITCQSYDGPLVDVWSIGCILLELTVGHEVFCDLWMPAYNYELLQEPKAFEAKLLDCLCALEFFMRDHLHLAPERVDFILGLLTVDPAKRFTMEQVVSHPWIAMKGGASFLTATRIIEPRAATPPPRPPSRSPAHPSASNNNTAHSPLGNSNSGKPRQRPAPLKVDRGEAQGGAAEAVGGPTGCGQQPQQSGQEKQLPNRVAFSAGVMGDSSEDEDEDEGEQRAGGEGSSGLGGAAWRSGMIQKARSKMEQKSTKDDKAKELQLPPLEPMTPAVHGAKKLLKHGDELFLKATEDARAAADPNNINTTSMQQQQVLTRANSTNNNSQQR